MIYSIYLITNNITKKQYIGFTSKSLDERNCGIITKLYNSIKKYGWKNFSYKVIYQSKDYEHCLNIMEPFFIKEYCTYENGYNMTLGGEGFVGYWTEENRKKQSEFISSTWTKERRIKNGIMAKKLLTGKCKSEDHKIKLRGKRPHVNQSCGKNNNAKPIETPYGSFDSLKSAYVELNKRGIHLSYKQIYDRLNTKSDWNYKMKGII